MIKVRMRNSIDSEKKEIYVMDRVPCNTHLSTAVAWREKKFKHIVFYKYFSLVLGLLKFRILEKVN